MTSQTFTHKDLSREVGVSETTIKSYRRKFPEFISVASRGKPIRFNPETLDVCRRIRDSFEKGLSIEETRDILHTEFKRHAVPDNLPKSDDSTPSSLPVPQDLAKLVETTKGVLGGLEQAVSLQGATHDRLGRIERSIQDLFEVQSRLHTMQTELLGKLDAFMVSALSRSPSRPPADRIHADSSPRVEPPAPMLGLPVVVRSEDGDFLGVTSRRGNPFTLQEFLRFLPRSVPGAGHMHPVWSRDGEDWILVFHGEGGMNATIGKCVFRRTRTPKGNEVVHFRRFEVEGRDLPRQHLHGMLKQMKEHYET